MPGQLYQGNCNYTAISTIGTSTVDPGPTQNDPGLVGRWGVFYGFNVLSTGTAGMVVTALDLVANVNNTNTVTNTLFTGTATAPGQVVGAAPNGLGIRYKGTLLVVTTGTAATVNALWD